MQVKVRRGLDVRYEGAPRQVIGQGPAIRTAAVLGADYPGLRPTFLVEVGSRVVAGEPLVRDRRNQDRVIVSPVSGRVEAITRGAHRSLDTLVISDAGEDRLTFELPATLDRDQLVSLLMSSGSWAALLSRPFGRPADLGSIPEALFITAIDTRPLAADPRVVIEAHVEWFVRGASALRQLTADKVYLCHAVGAALPAIEGVEPVGFAGPHPAGLAGTHIHHLHPVGNNNTVWHIGYQDVIAIGHLLATGQVWTDRIVALGGPAVSDPGLYRTRPGASLRELAEGRLWSEAVHLYSGSILDGEVLEYLSRGQVQVSVVPHRAAREQPGGMLQRLRRWVSAGVPAVIPNSMHERVAPAGILPIPFLRAISIGDIDMARRLGALELVEEDMALLAHVDGSGTDFGAMLRAALDELADVS